jgi:hypothetical protein
MCIFFVSALKESNVWNKSIHKINVSLAQSDRRSEYCCTVRDSRQQHEIVFFSRPSRQRRSPWDHLLNGQWKLFSGAKPSETWSWPLSSIYCPGSEWEDVHLHSPVWLFTACSQIYVSSMLRLKSSKVFRSKFQSATVRNSLIAAISFFNFSIFGVTRRKVVWYRRFGNIYRSHLQG